MDNNIIPKQTPEEKELLHKRAKLSTLEDKLSQRELDLATIKADLPLCQYK